jgi:peptidoglycan/xylan/chitin deacetylase (PgdA/CDA1 family)
VVSFTFDDFPRSAYTVAGAILDKYGVRATYYVAMGLMGTENHLGEHFRREDLDSLTRDGHELANHTFRHISSRSVGLNEFVQDVEKGASSLRSIQGGGAPRNFAYPFGDVTVRAKKALGSVVTSARGIIGGVNGPEVDLNLLRANGLYGDADCYERAKELVLMNERKNSWLIFYTHDVRPQPSRYGCTPELFQAVVALALDRGARLLPVSKVLEGMGGIDPICS